MVARSRPVFDPDRMGIPDAWNAVTQSVIGAAMKVHSALGPGLLERLYEDALCHELSLRDVEFERQYPIRLQYKGIDLSPQRVDLVVGGLVVVELKSVETVHDIHLAQMLSYMRSADLPLGLLINFNHLMLRDGIHRRINSRALAARLDGEGGVQG